VTHQLPLYPLQEQIAKQCEEAKKAVALQAKRDREFINRSTGQKIRYWRKDCNESLD